jgi:hypothetical protein
VSWQLPDCESQEFADNMTAVLEDHLVQIYIRLDRLDGRGGPR